MILFPSHGLKAEVRISGSSTVLPIIKEAAKVYFKKTGVRISVKGGGSENGIADMRAGAVDIGMVSRSLFPDERVDMFPHLIGHDGVAIVVNSAVSLTSITSKQVVDIYSGAIANWSALGGGDRRISVFAKKKGRATRRLFDRFFLLEKLTPAARLAGSNAEVVVLVGSDPAGIGYVSIGAAAQAVQLGLNIRALALDGFEPSLANIVNGNYPFVRTLNLVTRGKPGTEAWGFLDFVRGKEGQEIVGKYNFIPADRK